MVLTFYAKPRSVTILVIKTADPNVFYLLLPACKNVVESGFLMTNKLQHVALLVLVPFLVLITIAIKVDGQQKRPPISKLRLIDYGGDLRSLLGSLATSYDVVIGFEVARTEPHSYVTVSLTDATLEDVMNAMVLSKPIYTWRKSSNGFEVLPKDRADQILDGVLSSFHVENASTYDALKTLIGMEEVVNTLRSSGIRTSETSAPHYDQARMSLDLHDVTIREALNRITSQSESKFWTYQRDATGPASLTIQVIGNQ